VEHGPLGSVFPLLTPWKLDPIPPHGRGGGASLLWFPSLQSERAADAGVTGDGPRSTFFVLFFASLFPAFRLCFMVASFPQWEEMFTAGRPHEAGPLGFSFGFLVGGVSCPACGSRVTSAYLRVGCFAFLQPGRYLVSLFCPLLPNSQTLVRSGSCWVSPWPVVSGLLIWFLQFLLSFVRAIVCRPSSVSAVLPVFMCVPPFLAILAFFSSGV